MNNEIVPFGKYKGQPLEVMATDRQYCEWLMAQGWFREKFQPLYTVIINNFGEPAETPAHNALQVKFLDPKYRLRFAIAVSGYARIEEELAQEVVRLRENRQREANEVKRQILALPELVKRIYRPASPALVAEIEAEAKCLREQESVSLLSDRVDFECGYDVGFSLLRYCHSISEFRVEIKPSLGDDFPATLRQMRRSNANVLMVDEYTGTGASLSQVISVFGAAGLAVVAASDVACVSDPAFPVDVILPGFDLPVVVA